MRKGINDGINAAMGGSSGLELGLIIHGAVGHGWQLLVVQVEGLEDLMELVLQHQQVRRNKQKHLPMDWTFRMGHNQTGSQLDNGRGGGVALSLEGAFSNLVIHKGRCCKLGRLLGIWKKHWSGRRGLFLEQLDRMDAGGLEAISKAVNVLGVVTGVDHGVIQSQRTAGVGAITRR